jgi:hypothetical protein
MMYDDIARDLLRRFSILENHRNSWDQKWQDIAERVLPQHAIFQNNHHTVPPDQRVERIFDATGALGVQRFAAVLESLLTPKQTKWHLLQPAETSLKRNYRVTRYLEDVRDLLFRVRYASKSGFAGNISEVYTSLGAFGTGPMLIEEELGRGIRYRHIHLAEVWLATDHIGMVDTVFRKFRYSARQARQRYKNAMPVTIGRQVEEAMKKDPEKEFTFLHIVMPAQEWTPGAMGIAGFAKASYHICYDTKELVGRGGYRTMPYAVPRYMSSNTAYGWAPALMVLPDIKTANEQRRTLLRQGQMAVDPPILLHGESGVLQPFATRPGATNYGWVSAEGKQLAVPFQTGANLAEGREEYATSRQNIQAAFLTDLFQILIQKPNMTATEVLQWSQEKGDLLAPTMGKQQSELLGPLIERELDILAAANMLPPMPQELQEAGGQIRVEYEGPLSRFQRSSEAAGFARTIETTAGMIQLDPSVMDVFDKDEVMRSTAEINNVPTSWLLDPAQVAQTRQARAQQQQAQMDAEQAPGQAAAVKSVAQAKKLEQGMPA